LFCSDERRQRGGVRFGQDLTEHAKLRHARDGGGRIGQGEERHELAGDAFAREAFHAGG
jgi:hypothetical protein